MCLRPQVKKPSQLGLIDKTLFNYHQQVLGNSIFKLLIVNITDVVMLGYTEHAQGRSER